MSKLGKRLIKAAKEGVAIARGEVDPATYRVHVPSDIDVVKIRKNMKLTREAFAMRFGLQLGTVRDWEQNKRKPDGAARVLLTVIDQNPDAVTEALRKAAA
jgi:putative transcriptional regulator